MVVIIVGVTINELSRRGGDSLTIDIHNQNGSIPRNACVAWET